MTVKEAEALQELEEANGRVLYWCKRYFEARGDLRLAEEEIRNLRIVLDKMIEEKETSPETEVT